MDVLSDNNFVYNKCQQYNWSFQYFDSLTRTVGSFEKRKWINVFLTEFSFVKIVCFEHYELCHGFLPM